MPRYSNLDPVESRGFVDVLKWQLGERRADRHEPFETPRVDNDGRALHDGGASLTWIGHSTFAVRLGGRLILTDPVLSERVGLTRRNVPVGVALDAIPKVDVVAISHAHHDHLDLPSIRAIVAHNEKLGEAPPLLVVPSDVGRYVKRVGAPFVERGWWESHDVASASGRASDRLRLTLVPQQHWSMRGPFDRNAALWGGWVIEGPEGRAYHAGDTGYFPHFGDIGRRAGPIDWAMLPIGAYDPVWFMKPQHMGPEEAGRAFLELGARHFVCMHWGTFKLTDEPMGEPVERIERWWRGEGPSDPGRLWRMDVGETRSLG